MVNIGLLKSGLFREAIGISHNATKKDILYRIMDIEREHPDNQEVRDLLNKARIYLIGQEKEKYEEWILPCLDYVLILIANKYGLDIKDGVINHGLLGFGTVEKHFKQKPEHETKDPLERAFESRKSTFLLSLLEKPLPLASIESKIEFIKALLEIGAPDMDYIYFDGECDNSTPLRNRAYELALEVFQNLPYEPFLLGNLGFALIKLGEIEKALTCFLSQTEKEADGYAWNNMAWCLMRLGRHEEALTTSERALELLPSSADVRYVYATILVELGHWDEAIEEIKNAISNLEPSELELLKLYYLLAFVLERKGDIPSAIFHWRQYLELVTGKKGHERAVFKVQEKLRDKGVVADKAVSEEKYPIRKISEDAISEIITVIQQVIDIMKNNAIKSHDIISDEELKQEFEVLRQKEEGVERKIKKLYELEPKCELIFNEAFNSIMDLLSINSQEIAKLRNKLLSDKRNKNIPYFILLRDVVSPLIEEVLKEVNLIQNLFGFKFSEGVIEVKRKINTVMQEIPTVNEIKEIDNKRNKLKKSAEFMDEINRLGIKMKVETLKWIALYGSNFKTKEKAISNVLDIPAILNEFKRLFVKEVIDHEFDYSASWIEKFYYKLLEEKKLLEKKCTLKKEIFDKLKDKLSIEENKKRSIESDLTEKIKKLNKENQNNLKILNLLQSGEDIIDSVKDIKKTGGIIGWIFGRKRKVEKVISELEKIYFQINKLKPGVIEKSDLTYSSIDRALMIIRTENEKIQQVRSKVENLNKQIEKDKDEITKKLNKVIGDYGDFKKTLSKEIENLNNEINNLIKEKEETEKLMEDCNSFNKKWPIHFFSKSEDVVAVSSLISNGNGKIFYGGLKKEGIFIYDIKARSYDVLSGHKEGITSIVINPEENFLVSTGYDRRIILWNIEKREIVKEIDSEDKILCTAILDTLLFAGGEKGIWAYELPTLTFKTRLDNHEGRVICLAVDAENHILYSGEDHPKDPLFSGVYVWDIEKITQQKDPLIKRLRGSGGWVLSLALSPDKKTLAVGEGCGDFSSPQPSKIILWDTDTLRIKGILDAHEGWVESLVFSTNGKWLISGDHVGAIDNPQHSDIFIWDIDKGNPMVRLKAHKGWVRSLSLSNDNNYMISGGSDGVFIWDFQKAKARPYPSNPKDRR